MTMGNIGWAILIYLVVGIVLDSGLSFIILKWCDHMDRKNKSTSCNDEVNGMFEAVDVASEQYDGSTPGSGKAKTLIISKLLWPFTLPIGLYFVWNNIIKKGNRN